MLKDYINRKHVNSLDQKLFARVDKIKSAWRDYRKRAYTKFKDPELLKIRLYDLRHWFATTTYMKTRDIFFVKYLLGHRRIENTMIYMHPANALTTNSEDYTCSIATRAPENTYLITTLETNRSSTKSISKAPETSIRLRDFKTLSWDKKLVTVEPIMDFDLDEFTEQIVSIKPLCVFIGYNSKPKKVQIPGPSKEKTLALIHRLENEGIRVLTKEMWDPNIIHYQYRDYFEQ